MDVYQCSMLVLLSVTVRLDFVGSMSEAGYELSIHKPSALIEGATWSSMLGEFRSLFGAPRSATVKLANFKWSEWITTRAEASSHEL